MTTNQFDRQQMVNAALAYARRGWHVLPVGAGRDRKLPYVQDWTNKASTDEDQIAAWWSDYPSANIGIATGPKSGFWVVDVDIKDGVDGWKSLTERFGHDFDFDAEM